ncbi:MAG: ZIP family metal transporter [Thermodesulfobacteriota bacterium]|nr:ZIP family metal transporter [Thermodesulfobacteriota bacterium]
MTTVQFNILFYSVLAGLSTVLGIILVILKENLVLRYSHYVNSFAAGLILGIAFFHLFPESIELSPHALYFIFLGFILFYVLESIMVIHSGSEIHFREKSNPQHSKGIVMFTGLFFHSFIDGIIIGVGFEVEPRVGLVTSLGVILHELPEGVTTFSLLMQSIKRTTALKMSAAVALATPIGALISLSFVHSVPESVIGLFLAVAGGSFLYVAASDLVPETHEGKGLQNAGMFLLGIAFLYSLSHVL